MQRDREQQLHDYIDGRLSTVEHEEFEAAMALDASLAAKVATYRAMGDALRDDDGSDEPGEAFYAGARERFESSRRPWIERLWSWEAASLLAAAALAFALFLPMMLEDGLTDETPGSAAVMGELDRVDPPIGPAEEAASMGPEEEAEPTGQAEAAKPTREGAPTTDERQFAVEQLVDDSAAGIAGDVEAAPKPVAADAPAPGAPAGRSEVAKKSEVREKERAISSATSSDRRRDLQLAVVRMPQVPPTGLALPTLEQWRQMADDPRFPTLAALGDPTAARRLLWVGESIDCDRLTATVEAGTWRIELYPGDDVACALLIPADGLPVQAVRKFAP